jgi:ABC-type branched-subunit amino acid transport system substrate-binding protein
MDLTIAVIAPLDGPEALGARPLLSAIRAAVQRHGPTFGGRVAVRALDDRRDPDRAVELVARSIEDPDVLGVVGPRNSGSALAVADLASAAGLPLLLPAATADGLTGTSSLLRMCAPDAATAHAAASLACDLAVRALWVESDATPYGIGLATAVRGAATRMGIVLTEDLAESDAAFLAMGEVEQAAQMVAIRGAGFAGHLIGAEGGPGAPIGLLAGSAAEGSWQLYPGTSVVGHTHVYSAEASAAASALLHAYESTLDRTAISSWLRSRHRRDVPSVLGPLWFDADGQREDVDVTVWRVQDGRAVPQLPCHSATPSA